MRFYFDYISPYAYLAWTQVHTLAARHGRTVEPVPVLFAALLNHHGQLGPAEIPAKRLYVFKNVVRIADGLGVPLAPPPSHPFNPLLALRISGLDMDADVRHQLIDGLFAAAWGGGPGVTDAGMVARIADRAGLDGADAVTRAQEPANKERLAAATADAIRAGVFGVPTIDVDGELFWGYDAFDHVDQFLRGEDPVSDELLARWADLPASAHRR